ncbi:MAG: hypothetical protein HW380_3762, partial [Magnetococcales bacterium]|nr:hypothetical protein [Magnetococcales bacterium]
AGMEITKRLSELDPKNAVWQRDLAISNERMGTILAEMDRGEEAITYLQQEIAIVEAVFARFPNQRPFQYDLDGVRELLDKIKEKTKK